MPSRMDHDGDGASSALPEKELSPAMVSKVISLFWCVTQKKSRRGGTP